MVADARPRTVATFVETTFATPPADWDASGQEVYVISPDVSSIEQAHVANENIVSTHMGAHSMVRGLRSGAGASFGAYMHGSPNTTAENAQSVAIPLSDLLKNAWGGVLLGYSCGLAGGTTSAPDVDAGQGANLTAKDWGYFVDTTTGEGEFARIASIATDTLTLSDKLLTFTPHATEDQMKAVIVAYPHGEALTEHDDADHKTMSLIFKGVHSEDNYEISGCKANVSIDAIEAGVPTKLNFEWKVTTWDCDGITQPTLSGTPAGEAPGIPGTGDDTTVWFADKGSAMASSVDFYSVTPEIGISQEQVMGPNGTEGVHGYSATGLTENFLTVVVPFDDAYYAEQEADTRKHLLVQVGTGDSAWGLYCPDLEYVASPKRVDVNGVTAIELRFRMREDSTGTDDYTRAPWNLLMATK